MNIYWTSATNQTLGLGYCTESDLAHGLEIRVHTQQGLHQVRKTTHQSDKGRWEGAWEEWLEGQLCRPR